MKYINETLTTPVTCECDVLIAGGGIAGIAAALSASRNGARVTLIEREYILGGLGTAGIVTIYLPLCDGKGHQVSFGIAEELLLLSIKHGAEDRRPNFWLDGGTAEQKATQRFQVQYNPHLFALLSEKLLLENGVKILYGTSIVGTVCEDRKIKAVTVENKSGRYAVSVNKSVVDCTGDADICKFANAKTQTFSIKNRLAAWHYSISYTKGYKLCELGVCDSPEELASGKEANPLTKKRFSGIDGEENSEMVQLSHSFILNDILNKKKNDPTYVPVTLPTIPQLRMTRRVDGAYTMDDTEIGKHFDDSVGMFSDWRKIGPVYELPFSTLYGNDIDNLLCAGRCISVTNAMWDITRVIPVCAVSGQAAGLAASMGDNMGQLDIPNLQDKLTKAGVVLHKTID